MRCERQAGSAVSHQAASIAVALVRRAVQAQLPFRAVVADSFYGEDRGVKRGLRELGVGYVLALKPSHEWWHPVRAIGSFQEAARAGRWKSPEQPGRWVKVTRTFRDDSSQDWWALEVVRLYSLRMWVEQSYKHVKHTLGWSQYQVRSDRAIRRHWQLVCCAFSFCWYHASHPAARMTQEAQDPSELGVPPPQQPSVPIDEEGTGEKNQRGKRDAATDVLAQGAAGSARMVGALDHAAALLARVVATAPTPPVATPAHLV